VIGYLAGMASGVCQSSTAYFNKKALDKSTVFVAMLGMYLASMPIHLVINYLIIGIPELKTGFWLYTIITAIGVVIGTYLVIKAVSISDFGKVMPLVALTPAIVIVVAIFLNNETPTLIGAIGVLLVALGAFVLNGGSLDVFKDKGARYVMAVAIMYSFTSSIAKLGVQASNPFFYAMATCVVMAIISGVIVLVKKLPLRADKRIIITAGITGLSSGIFTGIALNAMFVSYAIAVKRSASVFTSIIIGKTKLGEKNFKQRIISGAIMCVGLGMIALAG